MKYQRFQNQNKTEVSFRKPPPKSEDRRKFAYCQISSQLTDTTSPSGKLGISPPPSNVPPEKFFIGPVPNLLRSEPLPSLVLTERKNEENSREEGASRFIS